MSSRQISRRAFLTGLAAGALVTVTGCALQPAPALNAGGLNDLLKQTDPFDVCIIGSGPAGAVLAQALVDKGYRTVVLESGLNTKGEPDARIKGLEVYQSVGPLAYPLGATRMRGLGGTSNMWTGRCARFYPSDFERNAYTPADGAWPVSYAEIEPYYERAEQTLRVSGGKLSQFHPPRKGDLPLPSRTNIAGLQSLMQSFGITVDESPSSVGAYDQKGPLRVAVDLLPKFAASKNALLISGVTSTRLLTLSDGSIEGVEVKSLDQSSGVVKAKLYVVACGAIETARLLLLSRSDAFPNGIGNASDQVGRYFMEHPNLIFSGTARRIDAPSTSQVGRCHQFYEEFKRAGFGSPIMVFYWNKDQSIRVAASLETRSAPENRVTLSPDLKDTFGNPAASLALGFTEDDNKTFEHTRAVVKGFLAEMGVEELQEGEMSWSHHHMGTARMGDDPATSVVDRNLRVHASPNLYLASSAAFVTGGASHPTLLITALCHRLAEHLSTQL